MFKSNGGMARADQLRRMRPDLIADLWLYPTEQGGKQNPISLGWGSPCTVQHEEGDGWVGYDGWPLLDDTPMAPGERRRVGYVFLSGQKAVEHLAANDKFYVWEGRIIGEAIIVDPMISN